MRKDDRLRRKKDTYKGNSIGNVRQVQYMKQTTGNEAASRESDQDPNAKENT